MFFKKYSLSIFALSLFWACSEPQNNSPETPPPSVQMFASPNFSADSAYQYISRQVAFGARVPNTKAHQECGDYLANSLKNFGAEVIEQKFDAVAYSGAVLKSRNIIASLNPQATRRILLAAHWDTRPFADQDPEKPTEPALGANDGGSGVGILLEIVRLASQDKNLKIGLDVILFDSEDYGQPSNIQPEKEDTWCLGSQYWAKNKHKENYNAYFGILLDMVGAKNAQFGKEGLSMQFAPVVTEKVWLTAQQLGYEKQFLNQTVSPITDDHAYVNQIAKIPMIDIIEYEPSDGIFFGHYWHTHKDNMDVIDKNTLQIVGKTVLQVLYNENGEWQKTAQ